MKKILPFFLLLFSFSLTSQITYEDFEGGSGLTWEGLSGTYDGIVANPDPNFINMSANCGSFTKNAADAWTLMITTLPAPLDLSVNNQFKINVFSAVPTRVLFKLEGGASAPTEFFQNIANTGVWQEYTFDVSAASGVTDYEKIAIFFNPDGANDGGDTYLIDNIRAEPAGPCAGTVADADIIDDFECQRNASYGAGWDVIQAVANPDATGINTSSTVGEYVDPAGPWSNLLMDYHSSLDLSSKNQIKAKIWSSKAVPVLFKLEGGVSAPAEVWVDITETDKWVEYTADFSSQATADHKKVVIFFNGGNEPDPGDTYYIDDISFGEAPPAAALEDFENGASLGWEPLNGDMTNHGTFDGVIANPDQTGINGTPNGGQYTKGGAAFSTVSALLLAGLDLSVNPQLNLHVLAPTGSTKMTMQLVSPTQGNKDVTRDITVTGEWTLLEFNFEEFMDVTDFERINLLFDPGTAAQGTSYLFDNLVQSGSTVDPCENVVANPNIMDDFECQRNAAIGCGNERLTVINNPNITPENSSAMVGEYIDPTDEWSALCFLSGGSFDLSVKNQLYIKIWSTQIVPILFKLEGGTSPAAEVWMDVTETDKWVQYAIDFSAQAGEDHATLAIFFNGGQLPAQEDTYYVDDLLWKRAPYTDCIANYDDPDFELGAWSSFENGSLSGMDNTVVANPNTSGINQSTTAVQFIESSDGTQPWQGFFIDLDNYLIFSGDKSIRIKALMPNVSDITMKLENSLNGSAPNTGDHTVTNTVMGEWEEIVFDFSDVPSDAQFSRLVFIFNITEIPTSDLSYYIDDIGIEDAACFTTGVFDLPKAKPFVIYPNPVQDLLFIENMEQVEQVEIFNLLGQKMQTIQVESDENLEVNVAGFENGMYLLSGYDRNGNFVANAKFVKE